MLSHQTKVNIKSWNLRVNKTQMRNICFHPNLAKDFKSLNSETKEITKQKKFKALEQEVQCLKSNF